MARSLAFPAHLHRDEFLHGTRRIADETLHRGQVHARIAAEPAGRLFLTVVELVDLRPLRPGVVRGTLVRRSRHDLELHEAAAALAHRGADAVGAGIAAADDDHVPVARVDRRGAGPPVEQRLRARGEVVHGEVHALETAALDLEVARRGRPRADHGRVEVLQQELRLDVLADVRIAEEPDALAFEQLDAAQDDLACRASCSGFRT